VRQLCVALGIVCVSLEISAQNVVTVSNGATYSYLTNSTGQITTITNDDGSGVAFDYDSAGTEVGTSVQAGPMWLTVRHVVLGNTGYVAAMGLPALQINHDALGRTIDITADPNIHIDQGGEIVVEASNPSWFAPHSWTAASFTYDTAGRLTSTTLSDGLSLQLGTPDGAGIVHQTLYGAQGNTIAEASAVGAARGVRIVPAHLDAVAAGLGFGHQWAESLTFETTASGYLTTAFDADHSPVLYLVDVGPYRVGFSTDGTPLFYDVQPSYESISEASGEEPAPLLAGVAPNHIVVVADGRAGFYLDHPADSALYSAWTELDTSGNAVQPFAVLEPSSSSSLSMDTNATRRSSTHPHLVAAPDFIRFYNTTVCVNGYCWTRVWSEWVEENSGGGGAGSGGGSGPPAAGGNPGAAKGNQIKGDPQMSAKVNRALTNAKNKLNSARCRALLDQLGNWGKLSDVMKGRKFNDPAAYMNQAMSYLRGELNTKQCKDGDTRASTTVGSYVVYVCPGFTNSAEGMAADYLIHEMLHSLGLDEYPAQGAKTSQQITQEVVEACGS